MKNKLRFLAIFFIILFLLSSGIIAQSYSSGGYPSGDYSYGGYPSGGYYSGGYPSGGYNYGGYPGGDYPETDYPSTDYGYGYPDYDYTTAGPQDPPFYNYDQPAQWENLVDVTIQYNSPDGTVIYENLYNYCHDPDSTRIISLASEHEHYTLELIDGNLIIKDLEGGYTGTETVVLDCNSALGEFNLIVEKNTAPSAEFTYTPNFPRVTDTIQFQDLSTDSDGRIVSWSWNFDDGTTSNEVNPTHQYSQSGNYQISLTVWDDDGAFSTVTKAITIRTEGGDTPVTSSDAQRTIFSRIRFNEYNYAGDILDLTVGLFNDGTYNMDDVKVTAYLLDLGERRMAGPFDLDDGEEANVRIYLDIPADAQPGDYDIKIIASNDNFNHVTHRVMTII